jgi:acetyl esterase/lipase
MCVMRWAGQGRGRHPWWWLLSMVLSVIGASHTSAQPAPSAGASLRLASEPMAFRTLDVDYLQVDGKTFQATIYQPEGPGPFPAILDVHGGAWTREDVRRDEHALLNRALAALGMVVVAIDFRQSPRYHYPASVADANFAMRWLRAHAARFNASPRIVGSFGSSNFVNAAGADLDRALGLMKAFIERQLAGQ